MKGLLELMFSLTGKCLKLIVFLLGLFKFVDVAKLYLMKAGDFLDNYKFDDSFKG